MKFRPPEHIKEVIQKDADKHNMTITQYLIKCYYKSKGVS